MLSISIPIDYANSFSGHDRQLVIFPPPVFRTAEGIFHAGIAAIVRSSSPYWLWGKLTVQVTPDLPVHQLESCIRCSPIPLDQAWVLRMPEDAQPPEMIWAATLKRQAEPINLRLSDFRAGRLIPMPHTNDTQICEINTEGLPDESEMVIWLTARLPHENEASLISITRRNALLKDDSSEFCISAPHPALTFSTLAHILRHVAEGKVKSP